MFEILKTSTFSFIIEKQPKQSNTQHNPPVPHPSLLYVALMSGLCLSSLSAHTAGWTNLLRPYRIGQNIGKRLRDRGFRLHLHLLRSLCDLLKLHRCKKKKKKITRIFNFESRFHPKRVDCGKYVINIFRPFQYALFYSQRKIPNFPKMIFQPRQPFCGFSSIYKKKSYIGAWE